MPRHHHRTCHLCEQMCGLLVETAGEEVVSIRPDPDDVLSRGHICPKGVALKDLHADPDRLKRPLKRTVEGFVEVSWDEAFDGVSAALADLWERHGRNALAVYQGNPTVHSLGALTYGQVFLRSLGTKQLYSATSADQLPHHLAALLMFGHQLLLPIPDVDRADLMVLMGGNPLVSGGSLMTAPGMKRRLRAIQERGGRVVVVDPRRTLTAELADDHLSIRPGTDVLLLLALLHVIFQEDLDELGTLGPHVKGLEILKDAVTPFSPLVVASCCGLEPDAIVALARALASTPRAVVYGRFGVSTQRFGGLCQWLIVALNAVTGHLDQPGGAMFTTPAVDLLPIAAATGFRGSFATRRSRGASLPSFSGELPVAALADEIERPGPGQIRGLLTHAGNPVLSVPNGRRLDLALERLDLYVAIDFYLNETTRHADWILPPASPLARGHYDVALHTLAVRNTAKYSAPIFERGDDERHDWEIFGELISRLPAGSVKKAWLNPLGKLLLRRQPPERLLDLLLRAGPHGKRFPWQSGLSMAELRNRPHGVDLGPLEPRLPDRLSTDDNLVDLAPAPFVDDLRRAKDLLDEAPPPLVLIGRRTLQSCNSWMHNSPLLVKGKDRCTAQLHPDDAAAFDLSSGDVVRLTSRTGSIDLPLEVTDTIRRGVVSVPHGFGHGREGTQLRVAAAHAGASVNDITDERHVDALTGNAAFTGVPVQIALADAVPTPGPAHDDRDGSEPAEAADAGDGDDETAEAA